MKKIYSIVFAAVALFSAASCQEELVNNETPSAQGENFTITAVADAQTKTALTDEGLNSVWTPGDAIAVIDYDGQGAEFTTAITENAASAIFACEDFNVGGLTDISALPIVALYPYQEGLTCSIQSQLNPTGDNTIKGIVFPHEQTAVAGSFDKTAAFTWAMATGATKDNLVFNNLYSLLKVKVTEENITEIKISATSGSLAGNVTLPMTQSGATLTVVDGEGKSEVTLTCEDGFDTEKYYYICVLPGTYEGFSIALNGYTAKTKASAATFAAATVYDLGEVARVKSEWALVGAFKEGDPNWIEIQMLATSTENLFVAEDVIVPTDYTSMLIKKYGDADWTVKYGGGLLYFNPNNWMTVYENGSDINVTEAGTYDFYFDKANTRLYIVAADADYTSVPKQEAEGEAPELEIPDVTENVIYLQPHEEWHKYGDSNNGWFFAAYFFGNGDTWLEMKDEDGDGYYECNIPDGGYTSVIFVQMFGNKTLADKWNAKKNQTVDLTIPTDGKNLFVMENPWNGDSEWKATGTWTTK